MQKILKRSSLVLVPLLLSLGAGVEPARSQALLPHVPQLDAESLREEGLVLAQESAQLAQFGEYGLALVRAQLASQLIPDDPQVWALLGSLYLQLQEEEEAIEALFQARALDPQNAGVLFALGTAYFRLENYERSVEYLQAGLRIQEDEPGALFDLGNAYFLMGRYQEAISAYEEAYEIEEDFWPAINNIGLVLYEQGDVDGAVESWQEAVEIDEMQPEPQLAIAVARYGQGQSEEAIALGTAALQMDARYADLEFLEANLWGERLLAETRAFFSLPEIRDTLATLR